MSQLLKYGERATVQMELPDDALMMRCGEPRGVPLDDPLAAVAAALADPLDFPPLSQAVVPGDRVAIALDRAVPQAAAVIAAVVHTLLESGVDASGITLVRSRREDDDAEQDPLALLSDDVRTLIHIVEHDPADRKALCYLAASRTAQPIYLNRAICDADVVLPISAARLDNSLGYNGIHGGLFPGFADDETQRRFRIPAGAADRAAQQQRRREEADEAAWLLGVQFTLQIIPGPGDTILNVLAGDANSVATQACRLCEAAWLYPVPQRASLVVATIEGGPQQQTWENFGRALFAASQAVSEDGAIVLCTELQREPGPALKRLSSSDDPGRLLQQIRREQTPDALSATLLVEARQRARVYLLSGLSDDIVEDLGVAYVSEAEEVARLGRRHDSCLLLSNAQHAVPAPVGE